jgi:hypothetical protein
MLKSLRKTIAIVGASLALALIPVAAPVAVYAAEEDPGAGDTANIGGNLACGSNLSTTEGDCQDETATGTEKLQNIVTAVVNLFSIVVGIVAVIMIVVGGFKYITSGGDSGNITSAKNTIVYAVIGLVIVALAQFLVKFVLNKVNSTP